ncbi:MAG: hypothetical protein K8T25_03870 [Planctomycetia bacterium]|nr:hypothetical protein [Planctomycetia bacterium]
MTATTGFSRRDFHRLAAAALGGLVGGALAGCGDAGSNGGAATGSTTADKTALADKHVCRGLNETATQPNGCAGKGNCSTVAAHECSGKNACKGQGGCGAAPGENECRGKGGCLVPLADHAWKEARANFEKRMKAAGKQFGPAPQKKA